LNFSWLISVRIVGNANPVSKQWCDISKHNHSNVMPGSVNLYIIHIGNNHITTTPCCGDKNLQAQNFNNWEELLAYLKFIRSCGK